MIHGRVAVTGLDPDVHPAVTHQRRGRDGSIRRAGNVQDRRLGRPERRCGAKSERGGETSREHSSNDATVPAGVKQAARLALFLFFCFACRSPENQKRAEPAARPAPVDELDVAARTPAPSGRPRVIWLGLDGLDWEILDRLAAEGKMPNWRRLSSEGWSARLRSFFPLISPILWTSAATGTPPDVHRVLDFQEVDPKTGRKVPISGSSRAVPAVWKLHTGPAAATSRKSCPAARIVWPMSTHAKPVSPLLRGSRSRRALDGD